MYERSLTAWTATFGTVATPMSVAVQNPWAALASVAATIGGLVALWLNNQTKSGELQAKIAAKDEVIAGLRAEIRGFQATKP